MDINEKILTELDNLANMLEEQKYIHVKNGIEELRSIYPNLENVKGISYTEIHVLGCIAENEGIYGIDIARRLNLTRGGISKITSRLVTKGLLETYQESEGQKKIFFRLTPLGIQVNAIHEKLHRCSELKRLKLLETYSYSEKEIILDFIQKIKCFD